MKIKILTKEVDLDEKLKKYTETKINSLDKLLKNTNITFCDLRLGKNSSLHKNNRVFFAEAKIKTDKKNYGAKSEARTIIEAVDELKDELSKKIRRHKDKKISLRKKGGKIVKELLRRIKK